MSTVRTPPVATHPPNASTDSPIRKGRKAPVGQLLIAPAIGILLLGLGYPIIWQIITSFQRYGLQQQFGAPAEFVGIDNYIKLVSEPATWEVVIRSVLFCFITAALTLIIGGAFALLMKAAGAVSRTVLQICLLLAWATPLVAAMTVWIWLFDRRRGVINYLLEQLFGLEMNNYDWFATPLSFFSVASLIVIWMSVPFVAFSLYAGLTQVSDEVLEAADLDGATGFQRVRYIIFPMIRPVLMIVLLLQLIWDLRVFAQIKLLQDAGSSATEYDLLGTYIHKLGTGSQDFGMASALSIFVLGLTIALSWFYVRSLLKEESN